MTAPGGTRAAVERVVLRAAVGDHNYRLIEELAELLDALCARGLIVEEGLGNVLQTLADEIVTATVLREFGKDLLGALGANDTASLTAPTPEDDTT